MRRLFLLLTVVALIVSPWSYGDVSIAQVQGTIVANGLNGPMGLLMDESGALWVIESGLGGDADLPFVDPQSGEPTTAQYGETAQVITISPDGEKTVVTALPSLATNSGIIGGARLATLNGKVYATVGQWLGDPAAEAGLPNMAVVAEIKQGSATAVASTWNFERNQNPDGLMTDSHPYGLTASPEGVLWVADAGGNALLRVNPLTGRVRLVAVFEGIPAPFPNPVRNNEMLTDPVPTAVVAKDGRIFVSLLSGVPFTAGSAKVVTVDDDGTVSDYATGLTMLTDLQLGPDHALYAVQFAEYGETGPQPNSGALVRIAEGEASTVVLSGLAFPTSIAFSPAGDAYIATNGIGEPGSGQVVMYTGVASDATMEAAGAAEVAPTESVTDTVAVTDTMIMTDTASMTDTVTVTDMAAMTNTMSMTDTASTLETAAMTDTMAMTETVAMTETTGDQEASEANVVADQVVATEVIVKQADAPDATRSTELAREPEVMPGTGASPVDVAQTTLPVIALILLGLAASAAATRRRQA